MRTVGETDGYVFEEPAECYLSLGEKKKAREFFRLAYRELSKDAWFAENEADRLARQKKLGEL